MFEELKRAAGIGAAESANKDEGHKEHESEGATQEFGQVLLNNSAEGEMFAQIIEIIGQNGIAIVENDSSIDGFQVDRLSGFRVDRGIMSPYMVSDYDRMEAVMHDPYILCVDQAINDVAGIIPLLEEALKEGRGLIIFAEDVADEALATLLLNKLRGVLDAIAIKAPGYGSRRRQFLEDAAISSGGIAIPANYDIMSAGLNAGTCGSALVVKAKKDNVVIAGGMGSAQDVASRINQLRSELESTDGEFEKEKIRERLERFVDPVVSIKVGGSNEQDIWEKRNRLESALRSAGVDILDDHVSTYLSDSDIQDIAERAKSAAGDFGAIVFEDGQTYDITMRRTSGMQVNCGLVSADMIDDDDRFETMLYEPYILVTDQPITDIKGLTPLLEGVKQSGRPLLIFADELKAAALEALLLNVTQGALRVAVARTYGYGSQKNRILEDIVVMTGASLLTSDHGLILDDATIEMCGTARMVQAKMNTLTIVEGGGNLDNVSDWVKQIEMQADQTDAYYEKEALQERAARISAGVVILSVGGESEPERRERMHRLENALSSM